MTARLPQKLTKTQVYDLLKEAKVIESSLDLGMDEDGTLYFGETIISTPQGGLYSRKDVCQFISFQRL